MSKLQYDLRDISKIVNPRFRDRPVKARAIIGVHRRRRQLWPLTANRLVQE
jgi:hypothetical protein